MGRRRWVRLAIGGATFGLVIGWSILTAGRGLAAASRGALSPEDGATLSRRFAAEIWPLLTRAGTGGASCVGCHDARNPSQLHFFPDAESSFQHLLADGFFEPESASSLLARVSAPNRARRMPPPPAAGWSEQEVATLRAFVNELFQRQGRSGSRADEVFPAALLTPYRGKPAAGGPDNTFLTYRQLRGKIAAIFGDDWRRGERDLFADHIELFGGADFRRRFNETSTPNATFLSAVDRMARDVATRAYLLSTGPFRGRAESLPDPLSLPTADPRTRAEIRQLYRRLLFREPSETEVRESFRFLQSVTRAERKAGGEVGDLQFEVEAKDAAGLATTALVTVPVARGRLRLYQELIDQSAPSEETAARKKLEGSFLFRAGDRSQEFRLANAQTHGNVSLAGIELRGPLPESTVTKIDVTDRAAIVEGAWRLRSDSDLKSYEDGNDNKGNSRIALPIRVPKDGRYEVTVVWRKGFGNRNAPAVVVEVLSQDRAQLALPPAPPVPPPGEARFTIDQTVDNIAFWDLKTQFRFAGEKDGVEIRNEGTRNRVVADAVKFVAIGSGSTLLLDNDEADGNEQWPIFTQFGFRPYNVTGKTLISDGNTKKGELTLLYRPSRRAEAWNPRLFYRVEVGFPGKADNETRAPVIVRAKESSPILQIRAPRSALVGSVVTLDASPSFNLQRTPLRFTWRQIGGAKVAIADPHAPQVTFSVVAKSAQQAAWEGLCRALVKHPDFLFTRPPSLATTRDAKGRRRLQLVKIAQDLVGRTPSEAELRHLDGGAPLVALINDYLASGEFRSFYFHRVRLYLESQGTEEEDEPARLWCYIAFNNRPFKEILTADYSVDPSFLRRPRPAYHGKTGLLTMKGFIRGKPGLPHFNYAAQVAEKFLGYVFEVPPEIVEQREGITAVATTSPSSLCYSCHKILTPLAYQRMRWTDDGEYRETEDGKPIDDSDQGLVPTYPYRGKGMEAFALQAQNKERFLRTVIQTHFVFYFGREMRYDADERGFYKRLWDTVHASNFAIKPLIRAIMTSPEYLDGAGRSSAAIVTQHGDTELRNPPCLRVSVLRSDGRPIG
jgi:hypothetical protein